MSDINSQLTEHVKELLGTVARNDEKIKLISMEQDNIKNKCSLLENKTHNIELKFETLAARIGGHDAKWNLIMDLIWKIILMAIGGYLLYALGLQADLAFPPS